MCAVVTFTSRPATCVRFARGLFSVKHREHHSDPRLAVPAATFSHQLTSITLLWVVHGIGYLERRGVICCAISINDVDTLRPFFMIICEVVSFDDKNVFQVDRKCYTGYMLVQFNYVYPKGFSKFIFLTCDWYFLHNFFSKCYIFFVRKPTIIWRDWLIDFFLKKK